MFELAELNPKYATELAALRLSTDNDAAAPFTQAEAQTLALDDGQLSTAETTLLLAGLGAILTSLWFTLTALF